MHSQSQQQQKIIFFFDIILKVCKFIEQLYKMITKRGLMVMFSIIKNLSEPDFREPIILSEKARKRIIEELGFLPNEEIIIPSGPRIIVKLFTGDEDHFIKKDGTKSTIFKSAGIDHHELMTSCVGLVCAMNKSCYQDERFRLTGPYCHLGEWAIIPRNEGILMYLKGKPVHIFYDDRVVGTVKDPKNIRRD